MKANHTITYSPGTSSYENIYLMSMYKCTIIISMNFVWKLMFEVVYPSCILISALRHQLQSNVFDKVIIIIMMNTMYCHYYIVLIVYLDVSFARLSKLLYYY